MGLEGRGRHYSRARGVMEALLARLYEGEWPAAIAGRLGLQGGVRVVRETVRSPAFRRAPLRIGFASDFHAGPTTHAAQIDAACEALAGASLDVLLLGGDFVFLHARYADRLVRGLKSIRAPLGKYAVMGNHDLWADDARIAAQLERAGVQVLVNRAVSLDEQVAVCGLDEPWTGEPDAARALGTRSPFRIVLMHAPSGLSMLPAGSFQLAFCGHTHGGHVALPGRIPIVSPGPLSRAYSGGRYQVGGATLLVSRGIGGIEIPFRAFAPPDVIVCDVM
jgi:hypothetical protein